MANRMQAGVESKHVYQLIELLVYYRTREAEKKLGVIMIKIVVTQENF